MKTKTNEPTVTHKWHIEVPTHTYGSGPAVFKVYFGRKKDFYFIWKGKSLLQSCQSLAEQLERYLRLKKNIETDQLYHVANHIRKTNCRTAEVDVISNDFMGKEGYGPINGYQMLKLEQQMLWDAASDPYCLNNNAEAYEPAWLSAGDLNRYTAWKKRMAKPTKK